jgi:hypothetical protein
VYPQEKIYSVDKSELARFLGTMLDQKHIVLPPPAAACDHSFASPRRPCYTAIVQLQHKSFFKMKQRAGSRES